MRLSDPLPLRTTRDLGDFVAIEPLPLVYGRVTLKPVRLDIGGRRWLLADHPIVAVERVMLDDAAFDGWALRHEALAGRAAAILELTRAPQRSLSVRLVGKPGARGAALRHPAEIAIDLLDLCGLRNAASDAALDRLHDDAPDARLAGRLAGGTLRAALATVLDSVAALWCSTPWIARASMDALPLATLSARLCERATASCRADDLADRLRVDWGCDYAKDRPLGSLLLRADADHGGRERTLVLPWIVSPRDALAIGKRVLAQWARPIWTIDATCAWQPDPWPIGATVFIDHPHLPAGLAQVVGRELDPARAQQRYRLRLTTGQPPAVRLDATAQALDDAPVSPLRIAYRDGVATLTVADDAGSPIPGAAVTLDGDVTRISDRRGQVQFKTARGPHSVRVVAYGYDDYEMDITI